MGVLVFSLQTLRKPEGGFVFKGQPRRQQTALQASSSLPLSFSCLTFFHYKLALLVSVLDTLPWLLILSSTSRKRHKTTLSLTLVLGPKTKSLLILRARPLRRTRPWQRRAVPWSTHPKALSGLDFMAFVSGLQDETGHALPYIFKGFSKRGARMFTFLFV